MAICVILSITLHPCFSHIALDLVSVSTGIHYLCDRIDLGVMLMIYANSIIYYWSPSLIYSYQYNIAVHVLASTPTHIPK